MANSTALSKSEYLRIDQALEGCKRWLVLELEGLGNPDPNKSAEKLRLWETFPYIQEVFDICGGDLSRMVSYVFNRECRDDLRKCVMVFLGKRLWSQNKQQAGMSYGFRQELV